MRPVELAPTELAAATKLFSSAVIKEMAKMGRSPLFARLVKESNLACQENITKPVGCIFDEAFSLLRKKTNRNEYAYKTALTSKLLLGVHSLRTASLISEFRVGLNKADVVILNGTSTVYEIKSERDKLTRLNSQLDAYLDVFARVNVIVAERHLEATLKMAPREVGVMTLNDRFKITIARPANTDPSRVNPLVILSSIQRAEAIKIVQQLGIEAPQAPNTQLHLALTEIFQSLRAEDVHQAMVTVLKSTRSSMPIEHLIQTLPKSLQAAVIATPLRQKDHSLLLRAVHTPLKEALLWA